MQILNNINKYKSNNALITEKYEIIKYKTLLIFPKKFQII